MSNLDHIRRSFELGSPFAQGSALYEIEKAAARIAALEAENERLRKALDEIATGPWFADKSYPVLFAHITAKAREALEAKP